MADRPDPLTIGPIDLVDTRACVRDLRGNLGAVHDALVSAWRHSPRDSDEMAFALLEGLLAVEDAETFVDQMHGVLNPGGDSDG